MSTLKRSTFKELKAFCEGYVLSYFNNVDMDTGEIDDWVKWGGYDINICGANFADVGDDDCLVLAYPEYWEKTLPDPIHKFSLEM